LTHARSRRKKERQGEKEIPTQKERKRKREKGGRKKLMALPGGETGT